MKLGLLTRNSKAWCSSRIIDAIRSRNVDPVPFSFPDISARVACKPDLTIRNIDAVKELSAIIVRPIGRGSLDEIFFRLDWLHRIERLGLPVINSPLSIEKAVDKYRTLALLEAGGLMVPQTIVTENAQSALEAFEELGGDVIVKPIFGSRGLGITRVSNYDVAGRIFRTLSFHHYVLYLQEFISHGGRDIRAFVVGNKVIAAMYRISTGWKTNISQGAKAVPFEPNREVETIAVKAAKILSCEVAGVDIMKGTEGYCVNEINSQPGFKALQTATGIDVAGEIVDHVLTKYGTNA